MDAGLEGKPVGIEIKDGDDNVVVIRTVTSDENGEFTLKFKVPSTATAGEFDIITNVELDGQTFSGINSDDSVEFEPLTNPEPIIDSKITIGIEPVCGTGTILKDGMCIVDTTKQESEKSSKGGGCLIATATYGSELALQV